MKRILRTIGLLVLVLVVGVVWLLATTFLGRWALRDGQDVDAGRIIADGFSSVVVVPMRDGRVTLVDLGADEAVAAIVLTHGYADHTAAIG